jgi:uncharacterized C2H2 Zn-finger protein
MPYVEYDEVEAVCSDCGRAFRSEEALQEHRAEAHSGQPGTPRPHAASVRCSLCQKAFRSTAALQEHNAKAHTG